MDLTIVIPTYNEGENVALIVNRIQMVLNQISCSYEILFVDDSSDDTPLILKKLTRRFSNVRYIHRNLKRGLASAVVEGFRLAKGEHIIVMDADLQHPPELIPAILGNLAHADIVIPSRFITGGSDGGLSVLRKLISWTARMLGKTLIRRLRPISDCTSGYFGITRHVITGINLDPVGWKILIEILVRGNYHTVKEIPYKFIERQNGLSKMSLREQWNYVQHIARLVQDSPEDRRFFYFCLVGTLGLIVNMLGLFTYINVVHLSDVTSSICASVTAMVNNFIWNDTITWRDHRRQSIWGRIMQFIQFVLVSTVGITVAAFCVKLFSWLNWNVYAGQLIGIGASTWWNFSANNRLTWGLNMQRSKNANTKLLATQDHKKIS